MIIRYVYITNAYYDPNNSTITFSLKLDNRKAKHTTTAIQTRKLNNRYSLVNHKAVNSAKCSPSKKKRRYSQSGTSKITSTCVTSRYSKVNSRPDDKVSSVAKGASRGSAPRHTPTTTRGTNSAPGTPSLVKWSPKRLINRHAMTPSPSRYRTSRLRVDFSGNSTRRGQALPSSSTSTTPTSSTYKLDHRSSTSVGVITGCHSTTRFKCSRFDFTKDKYIPPNQHSSSSSTCKTSAAGGGTAMSTNNVRASRFNFINGELVRNPEFINSLYSIVDLSLYWESCILLHKIFKSRNIILLKSVKFK